MATRKRSGYSEGAIVRVRCFQFLTYRDVSIHPGPKLNVVIGANGTGKSSIVCAIAIGLGAKTSLLGRADKLGEFVMQGCDRGFVEVEIYRESLPNTVIRRGLTRESESSVWHVDGEPSTQKKVLQIVERTGAQLSNLCTFLPQEKVGEFSGFDAMQLLRATELATGGEDLLKNHEALINFQDESHDRQRAITSKEQRLEELRQQNAALERDKEKMERRQQLLDKADLCQKRLLWLEFEEYQTKAKEMKKAQDEKVAEVEAAEQSFAPLQDKVKGASAEIQRQQKRFELAAAEVEALKKEKEKLLKQDEDAGEKVEDFKSELENMKRNRRLREEKIQKKSSDLEQKKRSLAQLDMDSLRARLVEEKAAVHEAERKTEDLGGSDESLQFKIEQTSRAVGMLTHELKSQGDVVRKRFQALKSSSKQGEAAVRVRQWLDEQGKGNRGKFRGHVYGPIAVELQITDPELTAVVEAQVPARILTGFVTECKEDFDRLNRECERLRAHITIYNIEGGRLKQAKCPYSPETFASLQRFGFHRFVKDVMQCPGPVLQVLQDHGRVDAALIGDEQSAREFSGANAQELEAMLSNCPSKSFVAYVNQGGGRWGSYRGQSSRYQAGKTMTTVSRVRKGRVLQASEEGDTEDLRRRLDTEQEALAALKADAKRTAAKGQAAMEAVTRASAKVRATMQELRSEKKLVKDISQLETMLAQLHKEAQADGDRAREVLVAKINKAMVRRLECIEAAAAANAAALQASTRVAAAKINHEYSKDIELSWKRHVQRLRAQVDELKISLRAMREEFQKARAHLKALKNTAMKAAPLFHMREDGTAVETELKAKLNELPAVTATVQAMLEEAQNAALSIIDNPEVIQHYQKRLKEIEANEKELAELRTAADSHTGGYQDLKAAWEARIERLVTKLNGRFEVYMRSLGNQGRIEMDKGATYKEWGIKILVSFRQGLELEVLRKNFQSGGERSVSTIMYLMALQDMVRSPFRVVDEINQGMDERNERIVFRRIVENSTGPESPQYFLITPKLLQGLTAMEHDDVTVLVVFNGPWNIRKHTDWDLKSFIEKRRAGKRARLTNGGEAGEPVTA